MSTPNVRFWKDQPDYSLLNAAWLCCDLEPQNLGKGEQLPPMVKAMVHRLQTEAKYTGGGYRKEYLPRGTWMSSARIGDGFYRRPSEAPHRKIPIPMRFPREALLDWALDQGLRPLFLFPEEQDPPKVKKDNSPTMQQQREDALREYLRKHYSGKDWKKLPVKKAAMWEGLMGEYPELFEVKYESTFKEFWKKQIICSLVNF